MVISYYDPGIDKCCRVRASEIIFRCDQMLVRTAAGEERLLRVKDLYMIIEEEK